jgi:OMF family outer membrane factor
LSAEKIIYSYKYYYQKFTMSHSPTFASAISVCIAMLFNNTSSAMAENLSLSQINQVGNKQKSVGSQPKKEKLQVNFFTASLPTLNQFTPANSREFLTASDWSFSPLQNKLAQLTPISPNDTSENLQPGLPSTIKLKLDVFRNQTNPLLLPSEPNEVTINVEQPITLQDAVSLALSNNQDVEISRLNINRSLAELQEAKAGLYPTLESSLGANNQQRAGADAGVSTGAGTGAGASALGTPSINNSATNSFDGSLSLSYDIYDGGDRGANIRSAKKQVRLNQLALEQTIEETNLQVATDYYDLQSAQAQVDIEQAAVRDATQTLRDAELLEQVEAGTKFEVLQAKVELAQAKQTLNTEQANQDIAQRQLSDTLNIGQKVELETADEITPVESWKLSLPKSIIAAYKNRAELKQFLLEREINFEQRQIALAENRPKVSLVASYDLQEQLDDGSDVADGYSVGATVDWAFFDGGAARARARQASTDSEIDQAEFANQRDAIRLEVENAYLSLNANQENITTANEALQMSEESLRLARLRFQAGVGTQTEVIDAQTELTTARGNLLNAIIDYNQSYAELQRAISNLS